MHELLTTAEMANADRQVVMSGVPSLTLMENAGRAVAYEAATMTPPGARIAILCGHGNNGGDGFVAARLLAEQGATVAVALIGDANAVVGPAREMMVRCAGPIAVASRASIIGADLIIDSMFGSGLSRPVAGQAADIIAAINAQRLPVLSVDVPSGLDGSTGAAAGPVVQAKRTITFFRKKPGHLLLPGRTLCGVVVVADIGIPDAVLDEIKPAARENVPANWLSEYPYPQLDGHKYTRGHAIVVSGPAEQTGAARLGARAALRIGAGLVTLIGDRAATAVNATHATSVMVRAVSGLAALRTFLGDERRNAVLIGPGASSGAETATDVLAVLQSNASVVLDADALTSFADANARASTSRGGFGFLNVEPHDERGARVLFDAIAARIAPVVMTPHSGEFKKLFGDSAGDKLTRARHAAKISGAIMIVKGADTVIAAPDGRAAINSNAPPWLATAGSGDVLAGLVTGLIAQGMPAFEAACAAVWLHGECGAKFGIGLIAEDLSEILPQVLAGLYRQRDP